MSKELDNTTLWNEAAKAGFLLGGVSIGCLLLKELAAVSGSSFLLQAAAIILWAVEFFGCMLIMKNVMLKLKEHYPSARMKDTYKLGRRAALLSGLLLASAQTLIILKMPEGEMSTLVNDLTANMSLSGSEREAVDGMMDKLPVITFFSQWIYCYLYGLVLSSFLSRYIFLQRLMGGYPRNPEDDNDETPEEQ